jgi:argininosuccinate synthase
MADRDTVVLAYSGGLDTSVAVKWIQDTYQMDVITLTIDLGTNEDLEAIRQRALEVGAVKALVIDATQTLVDYFIWPSLQAGAVYEGVYPLATALGRPLIAKLLVDTAHQHGAVAVAHGCTGKGNDQVRFDVGIKTLDPSMRIIAPAREWGMTREEEIAYGEKHGIEMGVSQAKPYSTDENLWGRSIECGVLEDPWTEPPDDIYTMTDNPQGAPDEAAYIEIGFQSGIPVSMNGEEMDGVALIHELNRIAGEHGVGRIDHVENRVVGIKSREIYEAPAAVVLHEAHRILEGMTLSRNNMRFKEMVSEQYADIIYDGLWFTKFHQDLAAYVLSSQQVVNGVVRMKLYKGTCTKAGVRSDFSLYSKALATYDEGDQFDHQAAVGFIKLHGLTAQTQAQVLKTALPEETVSPRLSPPELRPE